MAADRCPCGKDPREMHIPQKICIGKSARGSSPKRALSLNVLAGESQSRGFGVIGATFGHKFEAQGMTIAPIERVRPFSFQPR
jgi:hypothetical protein